MDKLFTTTTYIYIIYIYHISIVVLNLITKLFPVQQFFCLQLGSKIGYVQMYWHVNIDCNAWEGDQTCWISMCFSRWTTRHISHISSGWWFGSWISLFHTIGKNHPNWRSYFLGGVETTNQSFFVAQSNQKKFRRETWRSGLWTIPYDDKIIVTWKK